MARNLCTDPYSPIPTSSNTVFTPIFLQIVIVGAVLVGVASLMGVIWICLLHRRERKLNLNDEFTDLKTIKVKDEYSENSDKKDITRSQI